MKTAYLNNTLLMANLAKSVNATYVTGILPELRNTKKDLYKNELKEKYTIDNYFFALSDQELNKIKILPNRRLTQVRYEDKIIQENYLEDLRGALNSLAERESFEILDLINVADKAPSNLELFSTSIHFTNKGSDYLAENSAQDIIEIIKKD